MKAGWKEAKLGEVVTLNYGKALARSERSPDGAIPVYGANGVMDWSNLQLSEGPSLVIGRKGSAGEITRVDGPFWPSDVTYFTSHDQRQLDFNFLHYCLRTLDLPSMARGVKPGINRNDIYALPIPLPPLGEQQRIVAVLDEAFEGLGRARAHAEANLQNARELFESLLEMAVISDIARYGTKRVEELATEVTDGDHMPPPKADCGVPFITISNIRRDTREIDFSDTFKVPESYFAALKDKRKPRAGDILYTVTGATLGIPVLIQVDRDFCFQRHIGLIRPSTEANSAWLYFMMMSPFAFKQATEAATGAAQKTVSLKTLRGIKVPNTPKEQQRKIVALLRSAWVASKEAARRYNDKIQDLNDLRQSLLHKAFLGELT